MAFAPKGSIPKKAAVNRALNFDKSLMQTPTPAKSKIPRLVDSSSGSSNGFGLETTW